MKDQISIFEKGHDLMSSVIRGAVLASALVLFVSCSTVAFGQAATASGAQSKGGWRAPIQIGNCSHCEKIPTKAGDRLPIHHPPGTKLTAEQLQGARVFFQHCSLCHVAKAYGSNGSRYCCVPSVGTSLVGMFKTPEEEKAMRQIILNGMPNSLMPAWKYQLTAKDIDDMVAYIKTLD